MIRWKEQLRAHLKTLVTQPLAALAEHCDRATLSYAWYVRRAVILPGSHLGMERKMRYAGFWPRLFANLVDTIVGIPFIVLSWPGFLSRNASLMAAIPAFAVGVSYVVVMNAWWGQTLGKMAARIKIVTVSGARIGYREALLRDSVNIGFGIISTAAHFVTVLRVPESKWSDDWTQQARLLSAAEPKWGQAATTVLSAWFWGELLVLLFNRKRRALHDFIAGTVVIRLS